MSQIREAKLKMLGKLKEYELALVSLQCALDRGEEAHRIEYRLRMLTIAGAELKEATNEYVGTWAQTEVRA